MTTSNEILENTATIRFPDCDPFNHLNNSRYIDYFINAREDHLKERYKFDIYSYAQKTGKSWFVGQNQIAYLKPAHLMEQVIIQSFILQWEESEVLVEMRMLDKTKSTLKAIMWTKFVHVDLKTGKKESHSEEIKTLFEYPQIKKKETTTFEEKVKQVKAKL